MPGSRRSAPPRCTERELRRSMERWAFAVTKHTHTALCAAVYLFLVLPLLVTLPISFSSGTFLSYPLPGFSLRWYQELATDEKWLMAFRNSMIVATASMALATVLGTSAAIGLHRARLPMHDVING